MVFDSRKLFSELLTWVTNLATCHAYYACDLILTACITRTICLLSAIQLRGLCEWLVADNLWTVGCDSYCLWMSVHQRHPCTCYSNSSLYRVCPQAYYLLVTWQVLRISACVPDSCIVMYEYWCCADVVLNIIIVFSTCIRFHRESNISSLSTAYQSTVTLV